MQRQFPPIRHLVEAGERALTARSDEESERRIREAGLDPHLVKPVDPKELVAVIDSMKEVCNPS